MRENKRLLARIQNLEAELELERARVAPQEVKTAGSAPDETLIKALKVIIEMKSVYYTHC